MKTINKVQQIQIELMQLASFNSFDGDQVTKDLINNPDLWESFLMTREHGLIQLRDIKDDYWSVDTLFIISTGVNDSLLQEMAETWHADEIYFITGNKADSLLGWSGSGIKILRVWWD